jgi:hypothetical protein
LGTTERGDSDARSKQTAKTFLLLGALAGSALVVGALAVTVFAFVVRKNERSVAKAASIAVLSAPPPAPDVAAPVVVAPEASVSAPVTPAPSAIVAPAAPAKNSGETVFRFEGDLSPRLVFVGGAVVGTTRKTVHSPCGTHSVKIGSKGVARSLDLPCDGEQVLVIEANGLWRAR